MRRYDRRQEVTGLKVNNFPNVRKRYLSQLRAMLYAWRRWGYDKAESAFLALYDVRHRRVDAKPPSFSRVIAGRLAYLSMVRGKDSNVYQRLSAAYDLLRKRRPHDAVWILESEENASQGSAFRLKGLGFVTCSHVLGPDTKAFRTDDPGEIYPVRIVKENKDIDLAVLELDGLEATQELLRGDPARVKVGDSVTVLGFPNYNPGQTIHEYRGNIAGMVRRHNTDRFSISAPIIKGTSGGPVLNSKGEVIGIAVTGEDAPRPYPAVESGVISINALELLVPLTE